MNLYFFKKSLVDKIDIILPIAIFIYTFTVYIKFLAPSIFLGDPAEYCVVCYTLGIAHPNGYPIYTLIGHLFTLLPIGSVAYRINLMSAFFGAATTSLIYLIVLKIAKISKKIDNDGKNHTNQYKATRSRVDVYRIIAIIAALSLAFSSTFWSQSEFAEVYTFSAFFMALMILILLMWSENRNIKLLYVFFLIYGLSIGAHASNILFMPVFLFFIVLIDYKTFLNPKSSMLFVLFFTVGLLQFVYLLIRGFQHPEFGGFSGIYGWWDLITAKQFSHHLVFSVSEIPERISLYYGFLKANFLVMGYILGVIGIIGLLKKNIKILLLLILIFLLNVSFYLNYYVFDVETMFIPSFLVFSILIGAGIITAFDFIKDIVDDMKTDSNNIKTNILKIFIGIILVSSLFLVPFTSYITNYSQVDKIDDDQFAYFACTSLKEIPANSTIITYWRAFTVFKYFQIVDGVNSNVTIIQVEEKNLLNVTDQRINKGNVFIVHDIDSLYYKYYLIPTLDVPGVGTLYKVEKPI